MKKIINGLMLSFILAFVAACGGGGGSSVVQTTISGKAAKGLISGGTVRVFAIDANGTVSSAPLGSTVTDAGGSYSLSVGSYTGPVLVEVTGGTYVDEASGLTLPLAIPLRAAVADASGNISVAVTAITELAVRKAGGLTPAAINQANVSVAGMFGVADIIGTQPVDPASSAAAGASLAQKEYALALGGFSKYLQNSSSTLGSALEQLTGTLSGQMLVDLMTARTEFIQNADMNKTGLNGNTSATSAVLKLRTEGALAAANQIGGIQVTINLPSGVEVAYDAATGKVQGGAVSLSGVALAAGTQLSSAKFTAAVTGSPAQLKIILVNTTGFGLGEFVTVNCAVTPGSVVTASHFILTDFKAASNVLLDGSLGNAIAGVVPAFTATIQ